MCETVTNQRAPPFPPSILQDLDPPKWIPTTITNALSKQAKQAAQESRLNEKVRICKHVGGKGAGIFIFDAKRSMMSPESS